MPLQDIHNHPYAHPQLQTHTHTHIKIDVPPRNSHTQALHGFNGNSLRLRLLIKHISLILL